MKREDNTLPRSNVFYILAVNKWYVDDGSWCVVASEVVWLQKTIMTVRNVGALQFRTSGVVS